MTYPIALHIEGETCLVVGGGAVAARKIKGLLKARAKVSVVSPTLHDSIPQTLVQYVARPYESRMLEEYKPLLVFAATNDPQVNQQVVEDANALSVLVNAVDGHDASGFSNMTLLDRDPLTIAISTSGISPILGQHIRALIDAQVGTHYTTLACWLRDLRLQPARRRAFWQRVLESGILEMLETGEASRAHQHLNRLYQQAVGDYSE